jgi:hypothetical protein
MCSDPSSSLDKMEQGNETMQQDDVVEDNMDIVNNSADNDPLLSDEPIAVFISEEEGYRYIYCDDVYPCLGKCPSGWCSSCDEELDIHMSSSCKVGDVREAVCTQTTNK